MVAFFFRSPLRLGAHAGIKNQTRGRSQRQGDFDGGFAVHEVLVSSGRLLLGLAWLPFAADFGSEEDVGGEAGRMRPQPNKITFAQRSEAAPGQR